MPNFLHRTTSSTSHRGLKSFISDISRSNSPDSRAPIISSNKKIEEEGLPQYSPKTFYPAKIGEKLNDRYEILAKLGHGMTATVWLAKDLHTSPGPRGRKYVAIKINVSTLTEDYYKGRREIAKSLSTGNANHPGYNHVRVNINTFRHKTKHGEHLCIVYDVLREPLTDCQKKLSSGVFGSEKLRRLLPALLKGLDYMHSECHVVHTDLKPDNIMMGLGNDPTGLLDRFVQHLQAYPPPRKAPDREDGHIIYEASTDLLLVGKEDKSNSITDEVLASAKITDIGLAEWGDKGPQHKAIQANAFTCPEVLLGVGWSYPADIWNLAAMMWDLIEMEGLFDRINTDPGKYHAHEHLALMICLLGPPPKELLDRGMKTCNYFDYDRENDQYVFKSQKLVDKWKDDVTFDRAVTHMQGPNKESFIDFVKKMLAWVPEERWTAKQLLEHPWLRVRPGAVTCTCSDFAEAKRVMSEGDIKDANSEKARQSNDANSSVHTDFDERLSVNGLATPPRQGISQRSTNTSLMSVDEVTTKLPGLVVTPSR